MSDDATQQESQVGAGHDLSPLDPYVDRVMRWFAANKGGMPANGLAAAIAAQFDWPLPFAEAILVSVNGRRLLRSNQMSSRPSRLMLSRRGQAWLAEGSKSDEKGTPQR